MTFDELGIEQSVLKAIKELGYEAPTEIQEKAIPVLLEGNDVLGLSNTGTGKTATFGIPAIMKVTDKKKSPQALIICPTRELVTQVAAELRKLSKYKEGVKIVPIYGGQPIDRQIQLMKRGCAIVVGTPGRIMDHINRKTLKLNAIDMVILDEADEMLNMGFKEDITEILSALPSDKKYQTVLFSATMPDAIRKITQEFQENPVTVQIKSKQRTIDTVEQVYYEVPRNKKVLALRVLLADFNPNRCMIFCNTKKMVDDLNTELNNIGVKSLSIHGDMKQDFRSRVMEQFKTGNYPILIATDVAARGIDVDDIDLVVNFDIPQDFEYYIHRIGRTGRAGKTGNAVTLISGFKQRNFLKDLSRYTKSAIFPQQLPNSEQLLAKQQSKFVDEVVKASTEGVTEDNMEIANALLAEGVASENIIAGLVSLLYKPEIINLEETETVKRYSADFEAVTLRFSLGRQDGVQPGNLVAAITEECNFPNKHIGKIDIRSNFSLVDIDAGKVDEVLDKMQNAQVRRKNVTVEIDRAPKRKEGRGDRRDGYKGHSKSDKGGRGSDKGGRGNRGRDRNRDGKSNHDGKPKRERSKSGKKDYKNR